MTITYDVYNGPLWIGRFTERWGQSAHIQAPGITYRLATIELGDYKWRIV